ncbi:PepSY domain-containing protein [Streptomyces sp. NPDC057412]|uniref:PepSY domain-containing protein n=1 Tax=Streptomyces sp. NPDC057412 TaxID=3346123 RepID=UPI0036B15518
MRKRNAIAAIVVSGIMVGGAGIAMGGEVTDTSSAQESSSVQVRTDTSSGLGTRAASGQAVSTVAGATDAVIRQLGDGRVTAVSLSTRNGSSVWKVTIDQGKGPVTVTVDAATGEIVNRVAAASADDCATSPGTGTGSGSNAGDDFDDDDDDDDRDDDDDDDDDDDGPVREGVESNK